MGMKERKKMKEKNNYKIENRCEKIFKKRMEKERKGRIKDKEKMVKEKRIHWELNQKPRNPSLFMTETHRHTSTQAHRQAKQLFWCSGRLTGALAHACTHTGK